MGKLEPMTNMNKTIPPFTGADVKTDLQDTASYVYLYVGKEKDAAWRNATALATLFPALINYLVRDRQAVPECGADESMVGAVFGFGGKFHKFLSQSEADDFNTLRAVIEEAIKQ